ncbi:hypothetical protein ONE63_008055 [Megalurothrips usitatus]|uniref:Ubiquitin-like protease family profile domain-containing protein n=1 Tax=Megalurothrips usitatus TaxID=439358 RepID=A0AAV7XTS3_9NEOP|nr:hypothetical protein ONE63_008055 [Megalurothrips usitatus]
MCKTSGLPVSLLVGQYFFNLQRKQNRARNSSPPLQVQPGTNVPSHEDGTPSHMDADRVESSAPEPIEEEGLSGMTHQQNIISIDQMLQSNNISSGDDGNVGFPTKHTEAHVDNSLQVQPLIVSSDSEMLDDNECNTVQSVVEYSNIEVIGDNVRTFVPKSLCSENPSIISEFHKGVKALQDYVKKSFTNASTLAELNLDAFVTMDEEEASTFQPYIDQICKDFQTCDLCSWDNKPTDLNFNCISHISCTNGSCIDLFLVVVLPPIMDVGSIVTIELLVFGNLQHGENEVHHDMQQDQIHHCPQGQCDDDAPSDLEKAFDGTLDVTPAQGNQTIKSKIDFNTWKSIYVQTCSTDDCKGCENCHLSLQAHWTDKFSELLGAHYPNCVLTFKRHKFNNIYSPRHTGAKLLAYGFCKHQNCYTFTFRLESLPTENIPGDITFTACGKYHHAPHAKFRRNVRWATQDDIIEKLRTAKPNECRLQLLKAADKSLLMAGNFNAAPSLTVLQKIRSRFILCKERLSSDPWEDLQKILANGNTLGIDILGYKPFKLYWRSSEHLNALPPTRQGLIMYFDCTGQVVIDIFGKPVYYYAAVVHPTPNSTKVLPILEFLLDSHYTSTVKEVLEQFYRTSGPSKQVKTPFPKVIVIDFSWVLLYSCVHVFVRKSLIDYFNTCFEACLDPTRDFPFTVIHICGAHEANTVTKWIAKKPGVPKETAYLARRSFRALMKSQCLDDAKKIFSLMVPVFCNKIKKQDTDITLKNLQDYLEGKLASSQELTDIEEPEERVKPPHEECSERKTLYSQSRFYQCFKNIYNESYDRVDEVEIEIDDGEKNKFYFHYFISYLLKHQLPYFALWSACLVKKFINPTSGLLTNNSVEGWFNIVKTYILLCMLRLRPADFLRVMSDAVHKRAIDVAHDTEFRKRNVAEKTSTAAKPIQQRSKQDRMALMGTPAPTRLPSRKRPSDTPLHSQEGWGKKRTLRNPPYTPGQGIESGKVIVEEVTVEVTSDYDAPNEEVILLDHAYGAPKDAIVTVHDHLESQCVGMSDGTHSKLHDSGVEAVQKNPSESNSAQSTPPRPDGNDANLPIAKHGKTGNFNPTLDSMIASINLSCLPNELNADSIDSVQEWFTHDVVDVFFKSRSHVALADHHMTVNCCPVGTAQLLAFADDLSFLSLMEYCKRTSAFFADIWLWPLFDENRKHYTLLLVVMKHKVILYLDSKSNQYSSFKNEVIKRAFTILCALYKDMYNIDLPSQEWSIHIPEDVPQQSSSDCGPFICAWAHSVCTGDTSVMSSQRAPQMRLFVLQEIIKPQPEHTVKDTMYLLPDILQHKPTVPDIVKTVPCQQRSTSQYLSKLKDLLWKATDKECATPACNSASKMWYCVGYDCHDWYHLECADTPGYNPPRKCDYLCHTCRLKVRDNSASQPLLSNGTFLCGHQRFTGPAIPEGTVSEKDYQDDHNNSASQPLLSNGTFLCGHQRFTGPAIPEGTVSEKDYQDDHSR